MVQTESRAAQREQKAELEDRIHDLESRMREKESQHRKLQNEAKAAQREQRISLEQQLRDLELRMREKESQLRLVQASTKAAQQKAANEVQDVDMHTQALEKRHMKELNGLAKQILFLRARCTRAESFRESLGYQKRFFLMQIQMYSEW
jgi:chromosome segregation ATPase